MSNMLSTEAQYVGGAGYGGFGGGSLLEGLIFGALLSGDGFGGRGKDCDGTLAVQNTILEQTIAENQNFDHVTDAITASTYSINSGISALGSQIAEVKYDNALQMANQTSYLSTHMNAGFQSIKDAMTCTEIKDLERQLAVAQLGGARVQAGAWIPINPCETK